MTIHTFSMCNEIKVFRKHSSLKVCLFVCIYLYYNALLVGTQLLSLSLSLILTEEASVGKGYGKRKKNNHRVIHKRTIQYTNERFNYL